PSSPARSRAALRRRSQPAIVSKTISATAPFSAGLIPLSLAFGVLMTRLRPERHENLNIVQKCTSPGLFLPSVKFGKVYCAAQRLTCRVREGKDARHVFLVRLHAAPRGRVLARALARRARRRSRHRLRRPRQP